jgi:hypothetical protein
MAKNEEKLFGMLSKGLTRHNDGYRAELSIRVKKKSTNTNSNRNN